MNVQTINDLFVSVIDRTHDRVATFKRDGQWVPISSHELYRDVVGTAQALQTWGIGKGDRVAILSENRPEWAIADYAAMALGAAVVPAYPTLTGEQIAWLLRDAGVRVLFLSTLEQLRKIQAFRSDIPVE